MNLEYCMKFSLMEARILLQVLKKCLLIGPFVRLVVR